MKLGKLLSPKRCIPIKAWFRAELISVTIVTLIRTERRKGVGREEGYNGGGKVGEFGCFTAVAARTPVGVETRAFADF